MLLFLPCSYLFVIHCREQTVDEKKKPEMLERIVQGKVNKRMAELCLVSQVRNSFQLFCCCLLCVFVCGGTPS